MDEVNWKQFGLLVGQNKQFEDFTLGYEELWWIQHIAYILYCAYSKQWKFID